MDDFPLIATVAAGFTAAWVLGLLTQWLRLSPILRSMSVLRPASECSSRESSFGLTATDCGSWPPPYTTEGILPVTRRRRASFLPRVSRATASSVVSILLLLLSVAPGSRSWIP